MKKLLLTITCLILVKVAIAQKMERLDAKPDIICYAGDHSTFTKILRRNDAPYASPSPFGANMFNSIAQTGATIEVTYNGFSEEAQAAFQQAIDIWSELISSDVVIRVEATWQDMDEGVLGGAIWNTAYRNFEGAKELNVWYPVAIAEKMAGQELNSPDEPDIVATFNKDAPWYLGLDGNPNNGEFDLVTVVLHELGHGLGFVDSFDVNDEGNGSTNFPQPFIYDLSVENTDGDNLTDLIGNPQELGTELTSNSLFFNAPTAVTNSGSRPRLYAPTSYNAGSSIAHLNESTYPSGNPNSLMTPQIAPNEVIHDPGQLTMDMFGDMGWEFTYIDHTNRPNTEDIQADSYTITASIRSDIGYKPESIKLYYSLDGFTSDSNVLPMTTTANADEFTAEIPSEKVEDQVYTYYFEVEDVKNRVFTYPSLLVTDRFFSFSSSPDQTAPVITHNQPNFIRLTDPKITIDAVITDFLPVNAELEFFVNDGNPQTISFELVDNATSLYRAEIVTSNLSLMEGDIVSYKITATDQSADQNSSVFPTSDYIELNVVSTADPANYYFNDFNDISASAMDFFNSNNFRIKEEAGFDNGAIHSDHPYLDGTGTNSESNYTLELKIPIIVSEGEALMTFDEVVLIEPGDANSTFGSNDFYDYVIVEASKNGGVDWVPLLDGYDSRVQGSWLSTYNSAITDNNSTAAGTQAMYRQREINLLSNGEIIAGDEVLIRFRLFADEVAHGWGWAIDNLNIQLDLESPDITHNHIDFLTSLNDFTISADVTDNIEVDSVGVNILVNGVDQGNIPMAQTIGTNYEALINVGNLSIGDVIEYRIGAFDTKTPEANATFLPSEDSYFKVPIIEFGTPQESYSNNFDSPSDDFVGNFFTIETPSGFENGAIHSAHPYPLAFGANARSEFTYTLKTPIVVSSTKPFVTYNEVLLVQSNSDFAAVEGSKDGGATWFEIESYDTNDEQALWGTVFSAGGEGSPSLFKTRSIRLSENQQLSAGDEFLLRFKLVRRSLVQGWGWAIDDLEIQTGVIQGLDDEIAVEFAQVYPNPINNGQLNIQFNNPSTRTIDYSIVSTDGQARLVGTNLELDSEQKASIDVSALPSGLFVLKLVNGESSQVYKVLKQD